MSKPKKPFKSHIKKYRSWCLKHGYQSNNEITLLWYFNRQKTMEIVKNGNYWIIFKDKEYLLKDLIKEFKL